ncbi:hypothetical protein [Spirosoma arcticum]
MNRPHPLTTSPVQSAFYVAIWFWAVTLALLTAALTVAIVGDFRHPLSDGNDTDQYEYVGYFFSKNLSFQPFPHLNLLNNQTFYPYGLNQVFLDWGFERDYWYAGCYWLFGGAGPYIQFYYVYSLVITAVGTFALLQSRFGLPKAFIAGLIVSVFNFYAIYKFPVHLNVCVGHWTTLCIVATYRLLYDVIHKNSVSLPYVLLWIWFHVQILGQELAYVAGFALTFTTLALPVLAVVMYRQYAPVGTWPALLTNYVREQYAQHRGRVMLGGLLIGVSLYLFLPLTLQIAFTAWQFNFGAVPELRAWSHPARLLIPYLPGLDTDAIPYGRFLRDTFESYGQGSPGLYLSIGAGVGLWQTRRRVALWLPIVAMLLLCLLYHPVLFPTLKLFPWFTFNRHGGRASLVYPVLLVLLALPIRGSPTGGSSSRVGIIAVCGLALLMMSEWTHALRLRISLPVNVASADLLRYCAVVRQQPGAAVLDFPFCTVGADGVGMQEGLCPYYKQQNAVFTFRRFYDKSVVGQYFGRLHPDQIKPFLRDGWPRLLTPGRAFTAQDWQFLDTFLRKNNFAGINVYPDLLTAKQTAGFYQRYGSPIAETRFPAAGRVVFIPLHPKK